MIEGGGGVAMQAQTNRIRLLQRFQRRIEALHTAIGFALEKQALRDTLSCTPADLKNGKHWLTSCTTSAGWPRIEIGVGEID